MASGGAGIGAGGIIEPFLGAKGFQSVREVRHPELAARLDSLYGQYDADARRSRREIGAFTGDWNDLMRTALPQEQAAVGGWYDGAVARALAGMRAQETAARNAVSDRALQEVARGGKLSILGGGQGTNSSYLSRLGLQNASDILMRNAVDAAARERGDYDTVQRAQISLLGQRGRNQMQTLVPYNIRTADFGRRIGNLGSLGGLSDMAYFTGLKEKENFANQMADSSAAFWNTASTAASIYGSLMGGGGGGGGGAAAAAPAAPSLMMSNPQYSTQYPNPYANNPNWNPAQQGSPYQWGY